MMTRTVFSSLGMALWLAAIPALAQVNLTGKVVGSDGKGIPGVQVRLKSLKLTALTDADGAYRLDGNSGILSRSQGNAPVTPAFRRGRLEFGVAADRADVRIQAFDLAGKPVRSLVDARLEKGSYRIDPFPAGSEAGLAFLRVRIGSESHTLKLIGGGALASGAVSAQASAGSARAAAKTAAAGSYDTLLVSKDGYSPDYKRINSLAGVYDFFLVRPEAFWGDPASYPAAKNVMTYVFLNRTNGKYADDQIFWTLTGKGIATQNGNLKDQPTLDVAAHSAGRVTFHLGTPTGEYWDFMEQTLDATGWHGNTTRVDGFTLPVAMRLICGDGHDELLGEKYEVFYLGRDKFFAKYKASVPVEFQSTIDSVGGKRIVAPGKGEKAFGPKDRYADYFNAYFTQLGLAGAVTQDAFACAGPVFGQNAQLCGAVNRHTAHLAKSEWGKPENFYQQAPANYYARFFHEYSFQEKAYGFAYDDAAGMAAYSECAKPKTLIIAIGF